MAIVECFQEFLQERLQTQQWYPKQLLRKSNN